MYMRYLLACLLAALLVPASMVMALPEDDIEAQEPIMQFDAADDEDDAMGAPTYSDPNIDSGDIDEDYEDEEE
ncbi:MAG: hypothetical protein ACHQVS_01695 [Candidatus Babeliales bacterium]